MTCIFFSSHRMKKLKLFWTHWTNSWLQRQQSGRERLGSPGRPPGSLQAKCMCEMTDCQLPCGHQAWLQTLNTGRRGTEAPESRRLPTCKEEKRQLFHTGLLYFHIQPAERTCHTWTMGSKAMVPLSSVDTGSVLSPCQSPGRTQHWPT